MADAKHGAGLTAMVDAAMVEMSNIHPPLRRSECERLIRAALAAAQAGGMGEAVGYISERDLRNMEKAWGDCTTIYRHCGPLDEPDATIPVCATRPASVPPAAQDAEPCRNCLGTGIERGVHGERPCAFCKPADHAYANDDAKATHAAGMASLANAVEAELPADVRQDAEATTQEIRGVGAAPPPNDVDAWLDGAEGLLGVAAQRQQQDEREGWQRVTAPGQVKAGDKLRFTIGDKKYSERAKLILSAGTEYEEVIYNKGRNYYFITKCVLSGFSNHKNVEFRRAALNSGGKA